MQACNLTLGGRVPCVLRRAHLGIRPAQQLFTLRPVQRRVVTQSTETTPSQASSSNSSSAQEDATDHDVAPQRAGTPASSPSPSPLTATFSREGSPSPSPTPAQTPVSTSEVSSHSISIDEKEEQEDYFASRELMDELQSDVRQSGTEWFFATLATLVLVLFCPFKLQGLVDMLGTLCLTAGLVFIVYGVVSLGRNFSPLPQPRKKHALVTGGMYAYVRHPMYGGCLLATLGLACLSRSETRLALTLVLWWILEQQVSTEERSLLSLYPTQYTAYQQSVGKYIPFVH